MPEETSEKTPDYIGHRQRLQARFRADLGKSMPDYELLELLLSGFIPRKDVKPIAKAMIKKYGNLSEVLNADINDLTAFKGVSLTVATYLKAVNVCGLRTGWQKLEDDTAPVLAKWDDMVNYCRSAMGYLDVEEFRIIFLNPKYKVIGEEIQQRGTIDHVTVHPREVLKSLINSGATSFIMAHNHPSGNVRPSQADIDMTRQIKEAAETVDIKLIDHVIVSKNLTFSFKDAGLIK